jgi:hypothetical protein
MENRRLKILGGIKPLLTRGLLVGMFLLLLDCTPQDEAPAGTLSKEQMVKVLVEIYVSEEKVNRLTLPRDSALAVFERMEDKIFQKTGVTDSTFEKSLNYYFEHPDQLQEIYTTVVDSLQLREQRAPAPTS